MPFERDRQPGSDTVLNSLLASDACSMRDALRAIDRNACGIVFVVDSGRRLQGVVTDGDIRRAILQGLSPETPVLAFMTTNPTAVRAGTPAEKIIALMSEGVKYIPVVDEERRVVDYAAFAQAIHLPIASPVFSGNELRYVTECVLTNWISSQGRFVTEFERSFAKFCGVKHCVAVSNGTVALHLALVLAGVGPGDEVIVPTLTFIATANAVRYTGATPIFVDSESSTWTMDTRHVEQKITARTKAIVPVHLYGHPADMDPLVELASRHNLVVIEDAAQAHGATYKGRRVGSIGDVGCFSFYANKIVTTGEGGMLTTNDHRLAEQARLLRDHGMSKTRRYWHETVGFNYRLTNLQAAIGVAQMERIEMVLEQRAQIGESYRRLLAQDDRIELHGQAPWAQSVTWLFTALLRTGVDRDTVIRKLQAKGIDSRPVFHPIHKMPPYASLEEFPAVEAIASRGLSLPTWVPMGQDQIERICQALKKALP